MCLLALDRHMVRDAGIQAGDAARSGAIKVGRNIVQLVVECAGTIDRARLESALDRFIDYAPWPTARLRHPLFGKPFWEVPPGPERERPTVETHRIAAGDDPLTELLQQQLNVPLTPDRAAPLRFEIIEQECGRSFLVQTWFHPLMDPRGAETLIAHLGHLDRHPDNPWPDGAPAFVPPEAEGSRLERFRVAGKGRRYLDSFRSTPPTSPGGHSSGTGAFCYRRYSFRDAGTATRNQRDMTWRLALVGSLLRKIWKRHGIPEVPYLLPISVDLRKKGELGPVFSNHLSLHFPHFAPSDDVDAVATELRKQMIDSLRHGRVEATRAAMDFIRPLPVSLLAWRMGMSSRGELCSFNFADTGEFAGSKPTLFGETVVNSYHIPTVTPKPGIGIFLNSCGDNQNIVVTWLDGAVTAAEVDELADELRAGLGWISQESHEGSGSSTHVQS